MIERKLLDKRQDKTFVRYIDKTKKAGELYIYPRNDKKELEKIRTFADKNDLDVLYCNHTIKLNKGKWYKYNTGHNISIGTDDIYEMDTVFIDIDTPLFDNYNQLRDAINGSGIHNCKVYESASGNIHLYIKVSKFSDINQYKVLVRTIGEYLKTKGFEIDTTSENPNQKTYLEEYRVLSKNSFKSRYIEELSKQGTEQTYFDIYKELHKRGVKVQKEYSSKYAMYLIQKELLKTYSGELHITELHNKYLIPKYTFSRALERLQDTQAIKYRTIRGANGYIQVTEYNQDRFDKCIKEQRTRKQNFIYINLLQVIKFLKNLYLFAISECCKYIEKSVSSFREFVTVLTSGMNTQALLSGSSGIEYQKQGQTELIQQGERNQTLYKQLVRARYKGVDGIQLDNLAEQIHSQMQQNPNNPFTQKEVQSVLRWAKKITLYNRVS
jgi:hypothetical protein